MSWMIAELFGGVSSLGVNMTNDNRPKDALPRTRYNSLKQSISGRRRRTERRTFSVNPQQGLGRRLGLPILGYIPLEEPLRCPVMLRLGCGILISGGIRRRQPRFVLSHAATAILNHQAPCNNSTSVWATKISGTRGLLTSLFLRTSFLFLFI